MCISVAEIGSRLLGILFIIMAVIVLARNLIIWGPGFVFDFLISPEITNEKISLGMIAFGSFLVILGFRKKYQDKL